MACQCHNREYITREYNTCENNAAFRRIDNQKQTWTQQSRQQGRNCYPWENDGFEWLEALQANAQKRCCKSDDNEFGRSDRQRMLEGLIGLLVAFMHHYHE